MRRKFFVLLVFVLVSITLAQARTQMFVPAIDASGKGILTQIEASAIAGRGDVYVSVEPLVSVETQNSEKTAAKIAADLAGVNKSKYDLLYKIHTEAEIVDGPSGGAAMTLLAYAEFSGKQLRRDLSITGTIELGGRIGKISGVAEKGRAVAEKGLKIFLIPAGQGVQDGTDFIAYAKQKWGLQVVEVSNAKEAVTIAFSREGEAFPVPQKKELPPLKVEKFSASQKTSALRDIAVQEISDAKKILSQLAANNLSATTSLAKELNESEYLLERGYYYSAANKVFVAEIDAEALLKMNASKQEFERELGALEAEARQLNSSFAKKTFQNLEWAAAAELRYYLARDVLKEVRDKTGIVENHAVLWKDLVLAGNWLDASERINDAAKKAGEVNASNELNAKNYAEKLLAEATETNLPQDSQNYYNAAKQALAEARYSASVLASSIALAYADALNELDEKNAEEVLEMLDNATSYNGSSAWSELYYAHSIYSLQEANRTGETSSLVNALELQVLSDYWESNLGQLKQELSKEAGGAASVKPGLRIETQLVETQNKFFALAGVALLVAAIVLSIVLVAYKISSGRGARRVMGREEKMERLDELLLEKRISERTYERLREKYVETGRARKPKRRRRR